MNPFLADVFASGAVLFESHAKGGVKHRVAGLVGPSIPHMSYSLNSLKG